MTIPDDIIPTIGRVWCGSGNHDTVNCQGYLTWTQNCASAQSIDDPSVKLDLMKKVRAQLIEYHDTDKPWEFYVNLDDGEYLTPQGVKLIVRFKRILNLIPRNMQTVSVSYAALPTALDVANAIKLSSEVRRSEVITLKEELQHHKDEMHMKIEDLETSVIKSFDTKLLDLYKKLDVDLNQIYTSVMDNRVGQLPEQFDGIKEFLEKGLKEIQTRRLETDHVLVTLYRDLFDSRTPDATIVWKRDMEHHDPNYAFRGQWRKLADRLNWISSHNLRNIQVLPLYSKENLEYLRTIAKLTIEAMKKMFRKDRVIKPENLVELEDFNIFCEAVSKGIQLQSITQNQVMNFIQQMIYFTQCEEKIDCTTLDMWIGILLQTTIQKWNLWSPCACDQNVRGYCQHSSQYTLLGQQFPMADSAKLKCLLKKLDQITNQTCLCRIHGNRPLSGPSPWIKEPVPDYEYLKKLYTHQMPSYATTEECQRLYMKTIMAWIYARLYLYLTPHMEKNILNDTVQKQHKVPKPYSGVFSRYEAEFLNEQLYSHWNGNSYNFKDQKIAELADLKRSYCPCSIHEANRIDKLLAVLNIEDTIQNRDLFEQYLKEMEDYFILYLSTCYQQDHASHDQCELHMVDVRANEQGGYDIKVIAKKDTPHTEYEKRKLYTDATLRSMYFICTNDDQIDPDSNDFYFGLDDVDHLPEEEDIDSDFDSVPSLVTETDYQAKYLDELD